MTEKEATSMEKILIAIATALIIMLLGWAGYSIAENNNNIAVYGERLQNAVKAIELVSLKIERGTKDRYYRTEAIAINSQQDTRIQTIEKRVHVLEIQSSRGP